MTSFQFSLSSTRGFGSGSVFKANTDRNLDPKSWKKDKDQDQDTDRDNDNLVNLL